jgi:hypothetical protein
MPYHVIVSPSVSQAIGSSGLSRELAVQVLAALYEELAYNVERYNHLRIPGDEDRLFAFRVRLADVTLWHICTFVVDDVTAPDTLFVLEMNYQSRPIQP